MLDLVLAGRIAVLFDDRLMGEYREVLTRPKFAVMVEDIDVVLGCFASEGHPVAAEPLQATIANPGDLPFLEVAVTGSARLW